MRFSLRRRRNPEGVLQISALAGDDRRERDSLIAGVEKSFTEALLFLVSMVLCLSGSLEKQQKARL
jgi:hypothetical protein